MKRGLICYLQPGERSKRFLDHALQYRTIEPWFFYSDVTWPIPTFGCPPIAEGSSTFPRPGNYQAGQSWLFGLQLAIAQGLDEFMFVETDCGFTCDRWDASAWKEWDGMPRALCGGTPMVHNVLDKPEWMEALAPWNARLWERFGYGVGIQGTSGGPPALFPNGALAIYRTANIRLCFERSLKDTRKEFEDGVAWDLRYGFWLCENYGYDLVNRICAFSSMYSSCSYLPTSPEYRMEMWKKRKLAAIHNISL